MVVSWFGRFRKAKGAATPAARTNLFQPAKGNGSVGGWCNPPGKKKRRLTHRQLGFPWEKDPRYDGAAKTHQGGNESRPQPKGDKKRCAKRRVTGKGGKKKRSNQCLRKAAKHTPCVRGPRVRLEMYSQVWDSGVQRHYKTPGTRVGQGVKYGSRGSVYSLEAY